MNKTNASQCQLCLEIDAATAAIERLAAIFAATPIASVVIKPRASGSGDAPELKVLIEFCQKSGVAAFLSGDATLARSLRADGVHLPWSPDLRANFDEAREILGTRAMIGVEIAPAAEEARHTAMELAEAGADYIGFGAGTNQFELVSWWAEIFEVPCIALGLTDADAARSMAATGAEFIAISVSAGTSPADSASFVSGIATAVGGPVDASNRP